MSRSLTALTMTTDVLFIVYWGVALLALMGVIELPASLMYAGYQEPRVVAWNWSFLPTDTLFSLSGLAAVALARRGHAAWHPVAIISLCCTMIAGLMAVSYWTLLGEFDPGWFLPNLALVIWPMFFLPALVRGDAAPR